MSNPEFNNEFDILYNNLASNQAPPLDIYEKSVILTLAEEQLALNYYKGNNSSVKSFEETEELRRYLSTLVKTATLSPESGDISSKVITENSAVFNLPEHLWFITYERVTYDTDSDECISGKEALITPVTQDDVQKILENPFKGPSLKRVLRLDIGNNQVELISKDKTKIKDYTVRYLEYISPIILDDLTGVSINGKSNETECLFPEGLHRTILELAVEIAIARYKKA